VKALVVINPKAGGGKGLTIGEKVRKHFKQRDDQITFIQEASLVASLQAISQAIKDSDYEVLICVGGDGLIHDLLPTLVDRQLPMLVIPAGTGNDLARTLGLHGKKLERLLELPHKSQPSLVDIGQITHGGGSTPFVQILSTGFDSVVNEKANKAKLVRGKNKYVLAVLSKVWGFKPIDYEITIDGVAHSPRAMLVCVANGTSYGGGMKIAPHANHGDQLLDIMVVDHVNPLRLLLVFPRVFFGTHVRHPKVHFYTGTKIEISGDTVAFADGEEIAQLPISITISEKKLAVYRI